MQVYKNTDRLPAFKKSVITIGTFDGVHLGHVQIIRQLLKEAEMIGGTPVLITFFPHPKQVIESTRKPIFLLNTPEEKYALLHENGINHIVVVPFDKAFSIQTADEYIRDFLVGKFKPDAIIIGYDHRFGNNREGDYHLLEDRADEFSYKVIEIPEHILKEVTISSTRIRNALLSGDVSLAASCLGYDYFFSGRVVKGNKLGRTIGFPTANIELQSPEKLVPGNGVYAVEIEIENNQGIFKGMMNIGTRPTINGIGRVIEVHIFDFVKDIYDQSIKVIFKARLRNEEKFNGLDALKAQLEKDKIHAMAILGSA